MKKILIMILFIKTIFFFFLLFEIFIIFIKFEANYLLSDISFQHFANMEHFL